MKRKDKLINASVYLFSRGGDSPLENFVPTASNIQKFKVDKATIDQVIVQLEKLGFTVNAVGFTISISATIKTFEEVFDIKIFESSNEIKFSHNDGKNHPFFNHPSLMSYVAGINLQTDGTPF